MSNSPINSTARVAVITGAANGLGRALAVALAERNFALALVDIDAAGLDDLTQKLGAFTRCTTHVVDLAMETDLAETCRAILAQHDRVDLLINNAAISMSVPFDTSLHKDMQRVFAVNYWGTVHMCRHLLPLLRKSVDARIVNIISGFALLGFPGKSAYGSSKAAVMGFSQALRTELAASSVRVCVVVPPAMATGIVASGPHISGVKRSAEERFIVRHAVPVEQVAERIVRRAAKGDLRIVIGRATFWMDLAVRLFPTLAHQMLGNRKDRFEFL